jgi:hypothetical protein
VNGEGEQKKMKDTSYGTMSKLSIKKGFRQLGVHNKPVKSPFLCPELPSYKNPVSAPTSTGKRGDITTKITPTVGRIVEKSTKAKFSNKKKKIKEGVDRTKPAKENDTKDSTKKSMR